VTLALPEAEVVRRLLRSRQWHLREAGRQRLVASQAVAAALADMALHDAAVHDIDAELARLGHPQHPILPDPA